MAQEMVYHVRIGFDPKYASEMHGLFDVGRINELLMCYSERCGMWYINPDKAARSEGVQSFWSIVDQVEEGDERNA